MGVNVLGYVVFIELLFTNYEKNVQNMPSGMEVDYAVRCILTFFIFHFICLYFIFESYI